MTTGTRNSDANSYNTNGALDTFYVRTAGGTWVPAILSVTNGLPIVPKNTGGATSVTCNYCSSGGMSPNSISSQTTTTTVNTDELTAIAQGTSTAQMSADNKWLSKYFVYKDVLLNNVSATGTLSSFMQTNQSSDIGKLAQVNSLVESGNYSQAQSTISGITASSNMAANLKNFYTLYTGNLAAGKKYTLSTAQKATLTTVAQQCPYTYGPAVYHARAYLKACGDTTLYQNACETATPLTTKAKTASTTGNITQELPVNVYPNPAKDEVIISIPAESVSNYKVELINLLGKVTLTEKFSDNLHSMSLNGISQGIYICRIIDENGSVLFNNKLIIIK